MIVLVFWSQENSQLRKPALEPRRLVDPESHPGRFHPSGTSLGSRSLLSITRIHTAGLHLNYETAGKRRGVALKNFTCIHTPQGMDDPSSIGES